MSEGVVYPLVISLIVVGVLKNKTNKYRFKKRVELSFVPADIKNIRIGDKLVEVVHMGFNAESREFEACLDNVVVKEDIELLQTYSEFLNKNGWEEVS